MPASFFYEPIADDEFWKDDEENPEDSEITVLMDRRKDLYLYGRRIFPVLLIDKIKEKIGDEEKLGSLRIKLTTDVSVGDLISWDESFSGELAQRGVETNYAYFYGPSRITGSYAFDIVKADFADFDIPTIDIDDTGAYLSAPVFDGNTDVVAFGKYAQRYVEYDIDKYEGTQGRIWVDFTVCADGSVKDVVAVHGIESIRECAVEAVKNTPPYWTPARDKDGNPVNMRVHKIMVKVEAHL